MDTRYELMASAHEADLRREARGRRLASAVAVCRRRILGILPVGKPCEAPPTC